MVRDPANPRSLRSARESIRWLLRTRAPYLDAGGLKIPRDPLRDPDQLDVDDVLERLEILGVPDESVLIAFKRRSNGSAYVEVQVDRAGVAVLAPLYPELQRAIDQLETATDAPELTEPDG